MMEIIFLDPALAEMREAARWYDQHEVGIGQQFLSAVEQALDCLLIDPSARPIARKGIYRQFVDRFPFDLLYRICDKRIDIVAVAHHSRKPGYWLRRVR